MPHLVAIALSLSPLPAVAGWSSPDYHVRERATDYAARRFGPGPWPWADALTCPECQRRVELARGRALAAALARLGPYPCADSCWYDAATGRYDADPVCPWAASGLRAAMTDVVLGGYPHAGYRAATRAWAAGEVAAGVAETELSRVLGGMRDRDRAYYGRRGLAVPWE